MAATESITPSISQQSVQPKRQRGDGRLYRRGRTFWCAYYVGGVQQRESCHTSEEGRALKYLRTRLIEKHSHDLDPAGKPFLTQRDRRRTVSDLIDSLERNFKLRGICSPQARSTFKAVRNAFGDIRALRLTSDDVARYMENRLANGYAPASVNRVTQVLRQAFTFTKLPPPDITHLSEVNNVRQGFFNPLEIEQVLTRLPDDGLREFVYFGYMTGMRKGEIASLQWADVESSVLRLRGENAKNRKARSIALEGGLAELIERRRLRRQIKAKDDAIVLSSFVFHRGDGRPIREFRKSWATACLAAGLGKLVCPRCLGDVNFECRCEACRQTWTREQLRYRGRIFHDLRRSAVRDLIRSGVPEKTCMSLSGHVTRSVFDRYNITDDRDQRLALQLRAEYIQRQREASVAVMTIG